MSDTNQQREPGFERLVEFEPAYDLRPIGENR